MAKVIGLVASQRNYGNSHIIVEHCLDIIKDFGLETETVFLKRLDINHCNGCLACVYKGKCPQDDDMALLLEKMIAADGLVVAAPTYLFSPTSLLKKIIDRALMLSPFLDAIDNKTRKALCISIAGQPQWNPLGSVQTSQLALAYGYRVAAVREVFAAGPGEVILQEDTMAELKKLSQSLAESLQDINNSNPGSANICPICKNQVFRIQTGNKVQCAACGAAGVLNCENKQIEVKLTADNDNFFTIAQRKEHVEKYMIESRDEFLTKRQEIQERLKK